MIALHRRHFLATAFADGTILARLRPGQAQTRNVMETLAADGRFNRFIDLITQAGITDQLRSTASVTAFAPVDAAVDVVNARITELSAQGSGNINHNGNDRLRLREFLA